MRKNKILTDVRVVMTPASFITESLLITAINNTVIWAYRNFLYIRQIAQLPSQILLVTLQGN